MAFSLKNSGVKGGVEYERKPQSRVLLGAMELVGASSVVFAIVFADGAECKALTGICATDDGFIVVPD